MARCASSPRWSTIPSSSRGRAAAIDPRAPDFLSSHPATPERITNALANARQYSGARRATASPGAGAKDAYLSGIDGIVFGEDPSEGFVRGRRFLHPRLGFTFTAPEGFTLDNTAQAVLGVKQGGGEALRLDVVRVPAEQTLADYLTSGWIENIDAATVEDITINGFPAATATAKGDQWDFRLYAVRFGSDVYRFIFAAKHRTPETDHVFRDSIGTFRRMSLAEIEDARPLRLQIITVGPERYRRKTRDAAWPSPTVRSSASACSTDWSRASGSSPAAKSRSWSNRPGAGRLALSSAW